ncbi:MAG: BatD family protein [Hydrogenovibrio sp.]|nr:BatD family protein [Hydrogenovibrio sp.]
MVTETLGLTRLRHLMTRLAWLIVMLGLLGSQSAYGKTLSVSTDRQQVEMGDVINLVIQTDFQTFDRPDFSVLKDQFDVLGTQQSSQVSLINGNYQAFTRWDVSLSPKQAGELIIPPLSVSGVKSQPYKITVTPMQHKSGQRGISFIESSVNIKNPFVQQQVIYTLRYYHLGQLIDGNTRPPVFGNAIHKQLKNQVNYQKNIGGQLYDVYEWSWAFYPQKSGKMTIPAEEFVGRLQYQNRIKMIHDLSQPITLDVQPISSSYPKNQTWLPAKQLKLTEDWQLPNQIHVGDSLTRTVTISADGLLSSQLPDIQFEDQSDFHLYPDQAKLKDQAENDGVHSQKILKFAIVPTQAGQITLPAITLHWWDTATNRVASASLPQRTLTILPSVKQQAALTPLSPTTPNVSHETSQTSSLWIWQTATGMFAALWLTTLLIFLRSRTKLKNGKSAPNIVEETTQTTIASDLEQLCRAEQMQDARRFYQALLLWQQSHPDMHSAKLTDQLLLLKAHLYNDQPLPADVLLSLCNELKRLEKQTSPSSVENGRKLDPLYPD